jgi:hypothetical protein
MATLLLPSLHSPPPFNPPPYITEETPFSHYFYSAYVFPLLCFSISDGWVVPVKETPAPICLPLLPPSHRVLPTHACKMLVSSVCTGRQGSENSRICNIADVLRFCLVLPDQHTGHFVPKLRGLCTLQLLSNRIRATRPANSIQLDLVTASAVEDTH